jgi:hypothetical protein
VLTTHYFHGMFHNSGPHQSPQMGHHDCHKCTFSHLKLICTEISHEQLYPFIFPVTFQRILHSWHSSPFFWYICIHRESFLWSYQWIPIDIFIQQVSRLGFTKGSIPGTSWQQRLAKPEKQSPWTIKTKVKTTYHWGTNGAIQMVSPACTEYLYYS